ncbi:ribosomal RNA small subunit methyltransferase A [Oceanidesulfovibrio indonesiensis]|uniref:Ribosomal RNA small subunit methyltransferase A n=1 Tax=Oceanidesulfovibrio indonesiensis TaxID=54767 RepID=A0A7M3MC35_9BACT|nr:16S rRNA (adenine(1518)-N(6)/adenine(1519)-N(6))-dimethyltransferase RsmA [Oceanidesulfovibrio indonesiensis]TVM15839.1 ribosomal RNA small subunit methyltransferase A [Oceanidesulfovibrio indonesiensis]
MVAVKEARGQGYAKRSLGQNFLVDPNTSRRIVQALDIEPHDHVLEIGPGRGALTDILAASEAHAVYAVEKDRELAPRLKARHPRLRIALIDALDVAWERLSPEHPWKIIGNLPYNVASPIIWEIAHRAMPASRCVFMVQKEVAQRLAAPPGSKTYGALSVFVQSYMRVKLAFTVGPQVFRPRPKIDSAVVVFTRMESRSVDAEALGAVLAVCFQKRRKQLGSILKQFWSQELEMLFEKRGLSTTMRPENLAVEDFQALAAVMNLRFRP